LKRTVDGPARVRVESDPVLTGSEQGAYRLLGVLWVLANGIFWWWWLQPERIGTPWLFSLVTAAIAYDATLLPTIFLLYVGSMRRPRLLQPPPDLRVALVTLCVPRLESLDVIRAQLEALIRVEYRHDSWVLDEGNDPTVRALAARLGVHYFTRAGIERYNQPKPPDRGARPGDQP